MGHIEQEKLAMAKDIMRMEDIPFWVVFSEEGRDYTFNTVVGENVVPGMLIATPTDHKIIVSSLEKDNFPGEEIQVYSGHQRETLGAVMGGALQELGFDPKNHRLAFNYSTLRDAKTDLIGLGLFKALIKDIRKKFGTYIYTQSAENIIYGLFDRKTDSELEKMKLAAMRADDILRKTFNEIKPGMTERKAYDLTQRIMEDTSSDFVGTQGVTAETYAWAEKHCPIMLTGPNLKKGGHALTSDTKIEPGHTLYFDFGVKLTFEDGTSWCSDIQRMGYVLKPGETQAPLDVQAVFDTLVTAIGLGIDALRPGVPGYAIDEVVRAYTKERYPKTDDFVAGNYDHATGHALGQFSHNPGTTLSVQQNKRAQLKIQPRGVYTIEPRIAIPNGGSIEEDVVVNPDGENYTLCPRQTELYLVNS